MGGSEVLLVDIWREVGVGRDVAGVVKGVIGVLGRGLPVGGVIVKRVDSGNSLVETIAEVSLGGEGAQSESRVVRPGGEIAGLISWCCGGRVEHWSVGEEPAEPVGLLVSAPAGSDVVVGPLKGPGACCGCVIVTAKPGATFLGEHIGVVEMLLEPLSVALANELRVRELTAVRNAAEADKKSLLTRLGREKLTDTIIGVGSGLNEVMGRVELVAKSDAPVLIFGETGSGKELVARSIHLRSRRAGKAFIRVNCGAIPPELIDSELFGHERGAFTGAVSKRMGWFERADGGTLLLDEVAELPAAAQVRLLRILQDGWFERVGGQDQTHVDVRIVAATHADLAALVAENRFREDLWYRLAVFPILLPPLRHRRQDIPELARHFAGRAATRFGLAPAMPTDADIELMMSYDWPGNVREMSAVVDRAAILGDGKRLEIGRALGRAENLLSPADRAPMAAAAVRADARTGIASLEDTVRRHIESALRQSKGKVEGPGGAAGLLRVNPNTLRARMRKLGIVRRSFLPVSGV